MHADSAKARCQKHAGGSGDSHNGRISLMREIHVTRRITSPPRIHHETPKQKARSQTFALLDDFCRHPWANADAVRGAGRIHDARTHARTHAGALEANAGKNVAAFSSRMEWH
jgi:hypothetical protein